MVTSENRTQEFFNLLQQQQQQSGGGGGGISNLHGSNKYNATSLSGKPTTTTMITKPGSALQGSSGTSELRTFHQQASEISRDITNTSALLQELTYAIKHKSLFDNDAESMHMNHLVLRIKNAIENLNGRLEMASKTIQQQKRLHGNKDSQINQEATNVVLGLQTEFAETAADFKKVLQQRTDTIKETEQLQQQIYYNNTTTSSNNNNDSNTMDEIPDMTLRPSMMMSEPPPVFGTTTTANGNSHSINAFPTLDLTSSLMTTGEPTSSSGGSNYYQHQNSTYSGQYSQYGNNNNNNISLLTPLDIQRMEQEQSLDQQQLLQLIPDNNTQAYIQSRADAMSTVESNIVELGTIFQKLAGLVHEHKEMVQRVEDNVDETNANIFQSMNVLTDTLQNLRSNKALAMRLFGVLVTFIILFIIFFA